MKKTITAIVLLSFCFVCPSGFTSLTMETINTIKTAIADNIAEIFGSDSSFSSDIMKQFDETTDEVAVTEATHSPDILKESLTNIEKAFEHGVASQDDIRIEQLMLLIENASLTNNHVTETSDTSTVLQSCSSPDTFSECKKVLSETCLGKSLLLEIYAAHDSTTELRDVFPALVYQWQSLACQGNGQEGSSHHPSRGKPSAAAAWGYGFGFVILICMISNVGGCMIPFMKRKVYQRLLMFCVGLAVSAMASTGTMILLPESLELTGEDSVSPNYHHKIAAALGAVYVFYLIDKVLTNINIAKKEFKSNRIDYYTEQEQAMVLSDTQQTHAHSHGPVANKDTEKKSAFQQIKTVAWMVLMGDSLHKFVDGLSIGAAFTDSVVTGLSVSLAILCEELPHELGDIALLLHAGMGIKRALILNMGAALCSFVGLAIGILLGQNTNANIWIFAIAGGMFIYIALVVMLPEMSEQARAEILKGTETPTTVLVIQNLGLFSGFAIMFLLANYGSEIQLE